MSEHEPPAPDGLAYSYLGPVVEDSARVYTGDNGSAFGMVYTFATPRRCPPHGAYRPMVEFINVATRLGVNGGAPAEIRARAVLTPIEGREPTETLAQILELTSRGNRIVIFDDDTLNGSRSFVSVEGRGLCPPPIYGRTGQDPAWWSLAVYGPAVVNQVITVVVAVSWIPRFRRI